MSAEDRLRRYLTGLGVAEDDWDLGHMMLCDECEACPDYDGVVLDRCDVSRAHAEMCWALRRREVPYRQSFGSVSLTGTPTLLEELWAPALRRQLETPTFLETL